MTFLTLPPKPLQQPTTGFRSKCWSYTVRAAEIVLCGIIGGIFGVLAFYGLS